MATILANGCFDILHEGHKRFLTRARLLGDTINNNRLVVAVNSDRSARELKLSKWGDKYPIDDVVTRCAALCDWADEVISFDTEEELHGLIEFIGPCIIVKGPDYRGKSVTGDDLAPVIILDTPESELVRKMKIQAYGQHPNEFYNVDKT